jgi:protein chibby 1
MPIFTKKFQPKQCPQRTSRMTCPKIEENLEDFEEIAMNLNGRNLSFKDGVWSQEAVPSAGDNINKMKKKMHQLEEENNLNKVKVDVLLDMLTENVCELRNNMKK